MSEHYAEGTAVLVRYPRSKEEEAGDRANWPWLAGEIDEECGPDEWLVCVTAPEVATHDGADVLHPLCFRDASEIRVTR